MKKTILALLVLAVTILGACDDAGGPAAVAPATDAARSYDIAPWAPGVWLANTNPEVCYRGIANYDQTDNDLDFLDDGCELRLAEAFAPELRIHWLDQCQPRQPYWAATYFAGPQVVRLAYMPAWRKDCGWKGWGEHFGDSEFIMVEVKFNSTTRHWEMVRMFLSAHDGGNNHSSEWVSWTNTIFPGVSRGHPAVYVSLNKHANYRSEAACEGFWKTEACDGGMPQRFAVWPNRNVGSSRVDFFPNGTHLQGYISARPEYFYKRHDFAGWHGAFPASTPYYDYLMSSRFEYYTDPVGETPCSPPACAEPL